MIRINLLPIRQERRKEAGRNHLIIGVLAILLEMVVFYVISDGVEGDIALQQNTNQSLQAKINRIEKEVSGHDSILKEIAEFEKRQEAIDELDAARTGPVYVLLEISRVLSKDGRPTINPKTYQEIINENHARGYDENWDYRRVWITSFKEESKKVTIDGYGVTHEDVAEFLRRISLSSYFISSELVSTSLQTPKVEGVTLRQDNLNDVVGFTLIGDIRYK